MKEIKDYTDQELIKALKSTLWLIDVYEQVSSSDLRYLQALEQEYYNVRKLPNEDIENWLTQAKIDFENSELIKE